MIIYLYVVVTTFLILLIPVKSNRSYQIKLACSFIPIFLFGALRVNFGFDYEVYEQQFHDIHSYVDWINTNDHSEIGYILLQKIMPCWRLHVMFQSLFVCIAYYTLFYKFINRKNVLLVFALLFLAGDKTIFFMFSGIRNSIAISLFLLSLPLIIEKKTYKYAGLTILAMLFHTSAIIVMPVMYFICYRDMLNKYSLMIFIAIIFLVVITPIDQLVSFILPFMNSQFSRYESYFDSYLEIGETRSMTIYFSSLFLLVSIFISIYKKEINRTDLCLSLLGLITPFAPLLGVLNGRLSYYGSLFFILTIVRIFNSNNNKMLRWGLLCVSFAYIGYAFFIVFLNRPLFPYTFYHSILE